MVDYASLIRPRYTQPILRCGSCLMDKSHRLPFPLSAEEYEAIGALAAHYSNVEFMVGAVIWQLLKVPAYNGSLLTAHLSLTQRFELIISLLANQHAKSEAIQRVKEVAIEFNKDEGITFRRNRYIHAVWAANEDGSAHIFNFSKEGRLRSGSHDTAEAIETTIRDMSVQTRISVREMKALGYDPHSRVSFEVPPKLPDSP